MGAVKPFVPDGQTNKWLSLGFKTALNEEEIKAQQEALEQINRAPVHGQMLQLDNIYKMLALLNYQQQEDQARKSPSNFRSWTVQLNLLGAAADGAVDQILPGDSARKRMTLIASTKDVIISHTKLASIQTTTTVGSLSILPYLILPVDVRLPIESKGALYAITNDTATNATLTIIEELYNMPKRLSEQYKDARDDEKKVTGKNDWLGDNELTSIFADL